VLYVVSPSQVSYGAVGDPNSDQGGANCQIGADQVATCVAVQGSSTLLTTTVPYAQTYRVQFVGAASTPAPGSTSASANTAATAAANSAGKSGSSSSSAAAPTRSNGAGAMGFAGAIGVTAVLLSSLASLS
jgi:hypothetical protein